MESIQMPRRSLGRRAQSGWKGGISLFSFWRGWRGEAIFTEQDQSQEGEKPPGRKKNQKSHEEGTGTGREKGETGELVTEEKRGGPKKDKND